MNVWMELKRGLTLMDVVTRHWGRELLLNECEVMTLALLGEGGPSEEWRLASKCGRARAQVHRALRVLETRAYVFPLLEAGSTKGWALTDRGTLLWRCLDRGIRQFEAELASRVDLPTFKAELERLVTIFLNRPRAYGGWRKGLFVPVDLITMPIGAEASIAGLLEPEGSTAEEEELEAPPGHWPKPWNAAEREYIKQYWRDQAREKADEASNGEEEPAESPQP